MPRRGRPPKPITLNGIDYPSHETAAKALGVLPSSLSNAKRYGRLNRLRPGGNRCPVRIRGVDYPSQIAAARALGRNKSVVAAALNRGTIDNVGTGHTILKRPVTVAGVRYASRRDAAAALGLLRTTIVNWIAKARAQGGRYDHPVHGLIEVEP